MIGNDIIDLKVAAAESNPLRRRFIDKIFTSPEQESIENAKEKVLQIWIFWAMKEAAYKAHQRRFDLSRHFNPKQLECEIFTRDSTSALGVINIQQHTYYSSITVTKEYLHATASPLVQDKIFSGIFPASADLKKELLNEFSSLKNISNKLLGIRKNKNQVPLLQFENRNIDDPFSLSHHGFFSAFCLSLTNY